MLQVSDLQELVPVILAEGQGCECPHKDTCGNTENAWCRHVTRDADRLQIVEYRDLRVARCAYREKPGCCWVLAAVERLAANYLDRLHVDRPPVPSALISAFDESRDVEVRSVPLRHVNGAVWLIEDNWVVQLNATDSPQVRRETLFHEGFHIACRSVSPEFRRVDMEYKPFRDILADHFATCLLMPRTWMAEYASLTRDVSKMSETFDVSVPAMKHRLQQLDL